VKSSAAGSVKCAELTGVRLLVLVMLGPVPVTPMLLTMSVSENVPPKGLPPNTPYRLEVVDTEHGCAMTEWQRLGSPVNLSTSDADAIRAQSAGGAVTEHVTSADGVLDIRSTIQPWSIALLTRSPPPAVSS
jgi:hypothetical protein